MPKKSFNKPQPRHGDPIVDAGDGYRLQYAHNGRHGLCPEAVLGGVQAGFLPFPMTEEMGLIALQEAKRQGLEGQSGYHGFLLICDELREHARDAARNTHSCPAGPEVA